MIKSSAPGSIFLFGEHAAVYSRPAIVASVNLRTQCAMSKLAKEIMITSDRFGKAHSGYGSESNAGEKELFVLLDLCKYLINKFKINSGININIESEIAPAAGLSSSSAVLCSILCSFSKLFGKNISEKEYYAYLIKFQKKIHGGRASGAEITSSSIGGINYVSFANNSIQIKNLNKLPLKAVIGDSGVKVKTSKTVAGYMADLMKENPELVSASFNKIESICKNGLDAVADRDVIKLGKLITKNQEILASLGLSHPKLDLAIKKALEAGAYGAKLSGKGKGGVMFALTNNRTQDKVADAIRDAGLKVTKTDIGVEGVK